MLPTAAHSAVAGPSPLGPLTETLGPATAATESGGLLATELTYVALLSIAALVALLIRRVRLPYTVALVLAGLVLALAPTDFLAVSISSQLFFSLLVPPLIFEAALHLEWPKLRRDLPPVLLLSMAGSLLGTAIVAWGSMALLNLPLRLIEPS